MKINRSIVIIGEISSGKSTLAKRLSEDLKIPKASFGGYLSDYCKKNNISEDKRRDLQELGQKMIEEDAKGFLSSVITFAVSDFSGLIFEGVRHGVILKEIVAISDNIATIYLDATYHQRLNRFLSREKGIDANRSEKDFLKASRHPVEREVSMLKEKCSLIIESCDSVEKDYECLKYYIDFWLHGKVS